MNFLNKNIFNKNRIESFLFFCLPIIQLYDFEYLKDFILTEDLTSRRIGFPLLCTIFIPLFLLTLKNKVKRHKLELFFIFYTLLCLLSSVGLIFKLVFFINIFYLILLLFSKNTLNNYTSFIIGYTIVSVFAFFFRAYSVDIAISNLRNGLNIWGGLSLIISWLFLFFLTENPKRKKQILIISIILSLLHISRSGVIITTLIFIYNYYKINLKFFILTAIITGFSINYFSDYLNYIIVRFSYLNSNSLEMSRFKIWKDSLNIFMENPLGIGLGNYILKSSNNFSNSHNIFLTLIVELSVFAIPFIVLFFRPIKNMIRRKMLISYLLFLILLTFGGESLYQVGGSVSLNVLIGMLLLNRNNGE